MDAAGLALRAGANHTAEENGESYETVDDSVEHDESFQGQLELTYSGDDERRVCAVTKGKAL
jgi:hypothetical protein